MGSMTSSTGLRPRSLLDQMTLDEKVSQMVYDAPVIERLGIPQYNWWNECLHGVGRAGAATVFPQAIGLAATWNPVLLHRVANAISDEARAKHHEAARRDIRDIYTGLTFWSPNINLFRDPRWGRGQETYGEDPYLTAAMGVAFVKGLQGDDPLRLKLVATPKHYAVHSGPEPDRHEFDARVSEQEMRETYLFAFEACVKQARAASVMGAYNRVNGQPCCASPALLQRILRREWGFDGYVVSDCGAIRDIYENHRVVASPEEAAALAVANGCDLNCGATYPALLQAVARGLISEETIDQAVGRLLAARFRLGMFDPPEHNPYAHIPYEVIDCPEHRSLALEVARESIVLLKNEGGLLPLRKDLRSIAVIGPNADNLQSLLGNYHGNPFSAVTPLEGIRRKIAPGSTLLCAQGCAIAYGVPPLGVIPPSCLRHGEPDAAGNGLIATYFDNKDLSGMPVTSRVDRTVDFVWRNTTPLTKRWGDPFSVRWTGYLAPPVTGTYCLGIRGFNGYRLVLDGELLVQHQTIHEPVLTTQDVHLEAGRFYSLQLDYFSHGLDPQVQLLWAVPDVDHEAVALEAAAQADIIVAVMGLSPAVEGEEMVVTVDSFAGGDRTDIRLPRPQETLLRRLHSLGKPIVLVLLNGSALAVSWAAENIPAIIEAWYPGQSGGEALAEVLFGDYNPAGRLPVTFYRSVDDLPPFEDYRMENRTYRYFHGDVLFPFGHGLSYTTFRLDNLRADRSTMAAGEQVRLSADVLNTGGRTGDEVVQLYARDLSAGASRPMKELKGFERVQLRPGELKTQTFTVYANQFGRYDDGSHYLLKPGIIRLMVGTSSENLPLAVDIEITGPVTDVGQAKVFFSDSSLA